MKSRIVIILITLALIIAVLVTGYLMLQPKGGTPSGQTGGTNPFGSISSGTIPAGTPTVSITATDGSIYSVPDFRAGKQADVLPAGTYYHLTDNVNTQGDAAQFEIQYGTDNSITVVLLKEPIRDSRLAAEKALRTFFPLPDSALCKLNVFLDVPAGVNQEFAGQNLGLSFCPGSVPLP